VKKLLDLTKILALKKLPALKKITVSYGKIRKENLKTLGE